MVALEGTNLAFEDRGVEERRRPAAAAARVSIALLYKTQFKKVFRRARAILRNDDAARDVAQEVFLKAFYSIGNLRDGVTPAAWLYRVTTNHCLNWKRDHARRARLLARRAHFMETTARSTVEDRLAANELLSRVSKELAQIATAYYVGEMKQEEIALLVGVSRRTISYRLELFRTAARAKE